MGEGGLCFWVLAYGNALVVLKALVALARYFEHRWAGEKLDRSISPAAAGPSG